MFKEIWQELKIKLLDGLLIAWKEFLRVLWDFTQDEIILSARKSLGIIKSYLNSTNGNNKKEAIVDLIMAKLHLPVILKPFKGVIRTLVKNKFDEIIKELLGIGENVVNGQFKITG